MMALWALSVLSVVEKQDPKYANRIPLHMHEDEAMSTRQKNHRGLAWVLMYLLAFTMNAVAADYSAPVFVGEVNGQLDVGAGNTITINVQDERLPPGKNLHVQITRYPVGAPAEIDQTPVQVIPASHTMSFTVTNQWVGRPGDTLDAVYWVATPSGASGRPDMPVGHSEPKTLLLTSGSPPGAATAARLNTRYHDTAATCPDNKPAYNCNGIIIRSTESGAYDPWNPSPQAINLGGVSFSYMRLDAHVTNLYHPSGFILQPPADVTPPRMALQYLCIYAYDAGTLVGARGDKGCALKARTLGSCTSVGVSTSEQWYAYTQTIPNRDYQCSLSTDDPVQFQTSLAVRANRPPNMDASWNELMVADWGQDKGATLPMEAIFYKGTGLADAKEFQRKLKARNNIWLPVIKLDLNQLNDSPFSYAAEDQAVQP